jgi:hypothetical protein
MKIELIIIICTMIKKMDIKIYKTNVILYSRNFYLTTKTEDQNLVIIGL